MIEINGIEAAAKKELADEAATKAKGRVKDKLKLIQSAKAIVANLEREYQDLMVAIGEGN